MTLLLVRIAAACVLIGLTAGGASAQRYPQAVPMSPADVREDLELAREALEAIHPGYTRYADRADLDAAWDRLTDRAGDMTDVELYVGLSSLTAAIRCDHTKLELPERLRDARRGSATYFPFRVDVFDGDVVVLSTLAGSWLAPGDRVLSINGAPMGEILETISALLPVDGYTDHVRSDAFAQAGDFGPSGFEHFYPLVYGEWALADIVVERAGERVSVTTSPVPFSEWRIMSWDGPVSNADFVDNVSFDVLDGGIGYLRVDTFVNYRRPVDPREIYGPIFERIADEGIDTLIVDTRRNGGGSDDAQIALMAYLLDEPFTLIRSKRVRTIDLSDFAEHIDTWDPSALTPDPETFDVINDDWFELKPELDPLTLQPVGPLSPNFDGNVYALTSASNASAVTMMLATLRERGARVTLVGERTGGSSEGPTAGLIYFLKLPNSGITLRIPWQLQYLNIERPEPGLGVTPSIEVTTSVSDALAGRDVVLDTAIELARGNQSSDSSK